MNEKHFTILYAILTVAIVYIAQLIPYAPLRILGSSAQSVALYMASVVGFIFFLNGTGFHVEKEIVEQHNVALALLVGLLSIGFAITIHG